MNHLHPARAELAALLSAHAVAGPAARRAYAAMITAMDTEIGNVVQALERRGMRDGKASLYEGGTRVVGLANWPGHIPAGSVVDQPVHIVDMYPTLVALAGVTPGAGKPLDGLDVWPTLPSKIELSDLDRDPGETTNVAADHPAQLAQLRHRIEALAREAVPPLLSTETLGVMRSVLFGTVKFPAEAAAVDLRP